MNLRSVGLHGALLVAMLAWAWATSVRDAGDDSDVSPEGEVLVAATEGEAQWLAYAERDATLRIEARTDARGRWYYGEWRAPNKKTKKVETTVFSGGATVAKAFSALEPLRALRVIQVTDDQPLADFGLAPAQGSLTVAIGGTEHRFELGDKTVGGTDRYAKTPDGRVVVLPSTLVGKLSSPVILSESRLVGMSRSEIGVIQVSGGGRALAMRQHDAASLHKAFWSRDGETVGDDTYKAWVNKLFRVRPSFYESGGPGRDWTQRLTITVTPSTGAPAETIAVFQLPDGSYRVRADVGRLVAKVSNETVVKELIGDFAGLQ